MPRYILSFLLLSFYFFVKGQTLTSKDITDKGIQLYNAKKYDQALATFRLVNENDSDYTWALAKMVKTYMSMHKYDSAIIVADKGLAFPASNHSLLLQMKGIAYNYSGNNKEAIDVLEYAIKKYPYQYLLYYNLGLIYVSVQNYQKAQACFKNALLCNPFDTDSHLQLGKLLARQKQLTRAMLSIETYLSLNPVGTQSHDVLVYLENLSNNYIDTTEGDFFDPVEDNSLFANSDHYIRAKIALSNRYASPVDFNASLVKQTKLLMDVLPFDSAGIEDFWVQMYFPFYKNIKDGDFMAPFIYNMLRSTNQEDVVKYINKHEKEFDAFYETGSGLSKVKFHRYTNIGYGRSLYECSYYEDGNIHAVLNYNNQEKEEGPCRYFYSNGEVSAEGIFKEGLKDSTWSYYSQEGLLLAKEKYRDGVLNGLYTSFHPTGNVNVSVPYVDGEIDGTAEWFDEFGLKTLSIKFEGNKKNGFAESFYANGEVHEKYQYKEDKLEGNYISWYDNGNKEEEESYSEDMIQGVFKNYYMNGQLASIGRYVESKEDGRWISYYTNGNVSLIDTFRNGVLVNGYTKYYHNGVLKESGSYDKDGKRQGISKFYDESGILYLTEKYEHDMFVESVNYNKEGNVLWTYKKQDGLVDYKTFYPDGTLMMDGFLLDGKKDGEWKKYYKNGLVKQVFHYDNGFLNGDCIDYYTNSNIQDSMVFKDGVLNGPYKSFNRSGVVLLKGYYNNGNQSKDWDYYYNDGTMDHKTYIENGIAQGWSTEYDVEGNVMCRIQYMNNKIIRFQNFNPEGEMINDFDMLDSSEYRLQGDSIFVTAKCEMKGGLYYGDFIWYYPGGSVLSKKRFSNDLIDGEYARFDEQGNIVISGDYVGGEKQGKWSSYYADGSIKQETYFFDNEKDSLETGYFENGNVEFSKQYDSGALNGDVLFYDFNGDTLIKYIYVMDEIVAYQYAKGKGLSDTIIIKQNDKIVARYKNGNKSYVASIKNYNLEGKCIKYYDNGKEWITEDYKNGLLNGVYVSYYPNGNKKKECSYLNGDKNGLCVSYWENGKIAREDNFKNGESHGKTRIYNSDGSVFSEADMWSDKITGYKYVGNRKSERDKRDFSSL